MHVSSSFQAIVADSVDWRGRDVGNVWTFVLDDLGDENLKQAMVIILVFLTAPAPVVDSLEDLVVSRPKSQGWVVSGSSDLFLNFLFHIHQEVFTGRIDTIAEHKIVKEHNAFPGSQL